MGGTGSIDWYDDSATTTVEPPTEAAPDPRAFRWPRTLALAAITMAFLTICGVSWWLTHPDTFSKGLTYGTGVGPGAGALVTDIGDLPDTNNGKGYDPVTVTYLDVTARLAPEDVGRAGIDYVACRPTPETNRIISSRPSVLDSWCAETVPFVPGMTLEVPTWQVLAVITPRGDRPLAVEGFVLQYRVGIRAGQQVTGPSVSMNEPERASSDE